MIKSLVEICANQSAVFFCVRTAGVYPIYVGPLRSAVVTVADDDGAEVGVIDLVKDRLSSLQPVDKVGRYFVPESMYKALRMALEEKSSQLDEVFGFGGDSLA